MSVLQLQLGPTTPAPGRWPCFPCCLWLREWRGAGSAVGAVGRSKAVWAGITLTVGVIPVLQGCGWVSCAGKAVRGLSSSISWSLRMAEAPRVVV
jgi:hypothetical protein